jgi:Fe-S cluster assembly protein SufB
MTKKAELNTLVDQAYSAGFITDIDSDAAPPGLNEDIIRFISHKKNEPEFMLEFRLKAYRHWLTLKEPTWANVKYPAIDYQKIIYYSAPKRNNLKSLDDVDPEIL